MNALDAEKFLKSKVFKEVSAGLIEDYGKTIIAPNTPKEASDALLAEYHALLRLIERITKAANT
jgi:hypothetical protein